MLLEAEKCLPVLNLFIMLTVDHVLHRHFFPQYCNTFHVNPLSNTDIAFSVFCCNLRPETSVLSYKIYEVIPGVKINFQD